MFIHWKLVHLTKALARRKVSLNLLVKGKEKARTAKTADANLSTSKWAAWRMSWEKKQKANTSLSDKQMEDLTS